MKFFYWSIAALRSELVSAVQQTVATVCLRMSWLLTSSPFRSLQSEAPSCIGLSPVIWFMPSMVYMYTADAHRSHSPESSTLFLPWCPRLLRLCHCFCSVYGIAHQLFRFHMYVLIYTLFFLFLTDCILCNSLMFYLHFYKWPSLAPL